MISPRARNSLAQKGKIFVFCVLYKETMQEES